MVDAWRFVLGIGKVRLLMICLSLLDSPSWGLVTAPADSKNAWPGSYSAVQFVMLRSLSSRMPHDTLEKQMACVAFDINRLTLRENDTRNVFGPGKHPVDIIHLRFFHIETPGHIVCT